MFDKDGNGFITAEELKMVLGGLSNIDDQIWRDIIKETDVNGDGQISLEEFTEMMMKHVN